MGCLKLSYYEHESTLKEEPVFYLNVKEKKARQIKKHKDYYAGGMLQPGRNYNAGRYRFGYNKGSEWDDEITGVAGSHFTTFYREGDTRIMRWWSPDPKGDLQPWQSSYSYMDANPIRNNDPQGDVAPLAAAAIAGAAGFIVDVGVQYSVVLAMDKNANWLSAFGKVDYFDAIVTAGVSFSTFGTGAEATIAKSTANAVARQLAVIGTTSSIIQASTDYKPTAEESFTTVLDGSKAPIDALYDFSFDILGQNTGKAFFGQMTKSTNEDLILSQKKNNLTKSEKDLYKKVDKVVNSNVVKEGTNAVTDFAQDFVKGKVQKADASNNSGRSFSLPFKNETAPADATRFAAPLRKK
jgi:RHS repeat-associated protein